MISPLTGGNCTRGEHQAYERATAEAVANGFVPWDGTLLKESEVDRPVGYGVQEPPFRRWPVSITGLRCQIQAGTLVPVMGAAKLINWENQNQRFLWHTFGHPGSEASRSATRCVVYAKTPERLEAERRLADDFGGDMLAMVDSLRSENHVPH